MVEPRQACFVRVHPPLDGERLAVVPFLGARMTLGRGPECSVPLPFGGVDRQHARVERVRSSESVRVQDLGSESGTFVDGVRVPSRGLDCAPGGLLRIGSVLLIHRRWTESQLRVASLPPLPGPLDTRYPPLVEALHRVQRLCGTGRALWVEGPPGSGRSVALDHLRLLSATAAAGERLLDGGGQDVHSVEQAPSEAPPDAVLRLPSLRERSEDVPVLIRRGLPDGPPIDPELLEAILLHDWPGNVQELRVALRRLFHPDHAPEEERWRLRDFPDIERSAQVRVGEAGPIRSEDPGLDPAEREAAAGELARTSAEDLRSRLDSAGWRLGIAAEHSGVSRRELLERMAALRIKGPFDEPENPEDTMSRLRLSRAGGL